MMRAIRMFEEGQDSVSSWSGLSGSVMSWSGAWQWASTLYSSLEPWAELYKERSSSWWCQHHSPTLSLFVSNNKPQADPVAVRAYRIRDIKWIFKVPFVFYVIFIPLMSMTTYSQVPKFLNPSKLQNSTKSFMPTIPRLTICTTYS